MMNRLILSIIRAAVAFCAIAAPALAGAQNMGSLRLDSAYIDLGTLPPDTVVEVRMRFVNAGDAPLSILRIYSDCGCTVPQYSSDPVEAGGEGEISIRFNSRGRMPGAFRKSLRIRTDGSNPRENLIIKGRVRRRE